MARRKITTPNLLKSWRERYGLEQTEVAPLFFRSRRAYQNIEGGKLKDFPGFVDMICREYEKRHRFPKVKR